MLWFQGSPGSGEPVNGGHARDWFGTAMDFVTKLIDTHPCVELAWPANKKKVRRGVEQSERPSQGTGAREDLVNVNSRRRLGRTLVSPAAGQLGVWSGHGGMGWVSQKSGVRSPRSFGFPTDCVPVRESGAQMRGPELRLWTVRAEEQRIRAVSVEMSN